MPGTVLRAGTEDTNKTDKVLALNGLQEISNDPRFIGLVQS